MAELHGGSRVMSTRVLTSVCLASLLVLFSTPRAARAQAAQNTLVAGVGVVQYDLNGVGNAAGMTVRGVRALTNHLAVEASLPVAWPLQTFGRSRLFGPEA